MAVGIPWCRNKGPAGPRPVRRFAESALKGYYGTSTEAIPERVGVTQPRTASGSSRARRRSPGGEQALRAMADAYARLISARPETLLMQMQGYAVVAAAEAHGDDQMGELVRAGWMRLRETVHLSPGADVHEATSFFACGVLGNTLTAIGLSSDCREAGA